VVVAVYRRWAVPLRIAAYGFCLIAGPFLAASFLLSSVHSGNFMVDFKYAFYPAGHAVVSGHTPYVALADLHARLLPFVYPPLAAWLFAPLALLPYGLASVIYFLFTLAALWGSLALLRIRDPRCYTLICAWPAVLTYFQNGALEGGMLLVLVIVWRYRDRTVAPVMFAFVFVLKLFLWPLGIWFLLTRRWRAAVISAIAGAAFLLLPWAAIGFAGLTSYPAMLQRLTAEEGGGSYALGSLVAALQLPHLTTYVLAAAVALPGLACVNDPDRLRRDRGVLTGCLMLAFALTPILWLHYLVILLLPIALTYRRMNWVWWLPVAMLVAPVGSPNGALLPLIVFWVVLAAVAVVIPRSGRERARAVVRPIAARPAMNAW
jgi:Glycosyltransferase family 87